MTGPVLGELATAESKRDAVHVAVMPMLAVRRLLPGEKMVRGVVDPFLSAPVEPGRWYWLFLYPKTVTGMRHAWTAPGFPDEGVGR